MFWAKSRRQQLSNAAKLMNDLATALENAQLTASSLDDSREARRLSQELGNAKEACSNLSDEFRKVAAEFQKLLVEYRDTSKARYEHGKMVLEEINEAIESLN